MLSEDTSCKLSEVDGLSSGVEAVRQILASRRQALLDLLQNMPNSYWDMRSRCSDWSVHQVVRHVRDAAKIHVARLGGGAFPFSSSERFDPKTSPASWMAHSEGETPRETVGQLVQIFKEEDLLFARRVGQNAPDLVPGPLRRKLHWSVSSVHFLWDSWMHERDICVPLGLTTVTGDDEMRLVTMYALLVAAAPPAWDREYVDVTLGLSGSPDGAYSVTHEGDNVYVRAGGSPEFSGPMEAVLDSLAGRGPELSEVLGASGQAVRKLAILRAIAT